MQLSCAQCTRVMNVLCGFLLTLILIILDQYVGSSAKRPRRSLRSNTPKGPSNTEGMITVLLTEICILLQYVDSKH